MKPAERGATISNASPVLAALTDGEKAEILDALIAEDATFAERAGREGCSVLARVEIVKDHQESPVSIMEIPHLG